MAVSRTVIVAAALLLLPKAAIGVGAMALVLAAACRPSPRSAVYRDIAPTRV
jgi:hypothetical protein